jgi:hypothetical protein
LLERKRSKDSKAARYVNAVNFVTSISVTLEVGPVRGGGVGGGEGTAERPVVLVLLNGGFLKFKIFLLFRILFYIYFKLF